MHDFIYVTKSESKQVRDELYAIIHEVQDIVRKEYLTFQFRPVGSSSRNMITCDLKSNIGFDFDFDLIINNYNKYDPAKIRHIVKNAIDLVAPQYSYKHCEDSTRVLTIKMVDTYSSKIVHSCDFALIRNCNDGRQQYIRFNKQNQNYTWEFQGKELRNFDKRFNWLKNSEYWEELQQYYLNKKNRNNNPDKHSRSILAESVNEMYQKKQQCQ